MKNQFISVHFDFQLKSEGSVGGVSRQTEEPLESGGSSSSRSERGCLAQLDIPSADLVLLIEGFKLALQKLCISSLHTVSFRSVDMGCTKMAGESYRKHD